jgi:putative flippase GtrA
MYDPRTVTTIPTSRLVSSLARIPSAVSAARFAVSGLAVAVFHLSAVTILNLAGMPIQGALALGYALALGLHFTLNRGWVFASGGRYALSLSAQGARYLCVALSSYGLTAAALKVLPDASGMSDLQVFLAVTISLGVVNFLVLRAWVFRSQPQAVPR